MKKTKKILSDKAVTNILYVVAVVVIISVIIVTVVAFASQRGSRRGTLTTTSARLDPNLTGDPNNQNADPNTQGTTSGNAGGDKQPSTDVDNGPIELIMPCTGVLNKHHDLENLSYSMTMDDYRTHTGIDITADEGTPVMACEAGTVTAVYYDYFMGNCIEIDHKNGMVSIYKNLAQELPEGIAEGCEVSKGQTIGAIGSSAIVEQADEAHLHFELTVDGEKADPLNYIDYSEETISPSVEDK